MAPRRKTAFDSYVAKRMRSREFAVAYEEAKVEISATDRILRALDKRREQAQLSKAELARRAGMPAEVVRKLFTSEGGNPTMATVNRLAAELGMCLTLVQS